MIRRRSVAIELRLRADAEAKKAAKARLKSIMLRFTTGTLAVTTILLCVSLDVFATKEPAISEIYDGKQLNKLIKAHDFVAVYWYARNCRLCDSVLEDLETIDDDAEKFSVHFVKINDKRLAKSFGIEKFPALTFFRDEEMTLFEGDLQDEEAVLGFLTSEDSLTIPDKIEEVNAEYLQKIVTEEKYVTVLFFDESKDSTNVLAELENIDDEADVFKIRFVRIHDLELAEDYSLYYMPSLVYFRSGMPIVYNGDLLDETEVLEWLIQQQSSVADEDVVEKVTEKELNIMMRNIDHLLVIFHDRKKTSQKALSALEDIDDDCDDLGISFVEVDDPKIAKKHGVEKFPTLVYFNSEIPSVYPDSDLNDGDEVLEWLVNLVEGADIEDITGDMLDKMIMKEDKLAVLFYDEQSDETEEILTNLEEIDDDLDSKGVLFVKVNEAQAAIEYGIEERPTLVVFEKGIPNLYEEENFKDSQHILKWIIGEFSGDHTVEAVTDSMLDMMISKQRHVAAFFYNKKDKQSLKTLEMLETIDDEISNLAPYVTFVKIDNEAVAKEYGLPTNDPSLVFFEDGLPNIYDGSLGTNESDAKDVLQWVSLIAVEDNIEHVSEQMLERLLEDQKMLAVYFYDNMFSSDTKALKGLETIDDDLDREGVILVRLAASGNNANSAFHMAEKFGVDILPSLILFKYGRPHRFEGEISDEQDAIEWLREKLTS